MTRPDPRVAATLQMIAGPRRDEGMAALHKLAADGNGEALRALGEICWMAPSDEDAFEARRLFEQAGEAGDQRAAIYATNLMASGIAGQRDWTRAMARLESEARWSPERKEQLRLVSSMKIDDQGNPQERPAGEVVSDSPSIKRFPALFTPQECAYLVALAAPLFRPSTVLNASGIEMQDPVRSSQGATFDWLTEDPAVHALNRRIACASNTAAEQGEPAQVLRYAAGQEYRRHFDFVPGVANQRIATALIWLNQDFRGGETLFHAKGLRLRGRQGDAFVFRNALADGSRDPASEHAGTPVSAGVKYVLSRWIRADRWHP